MKKTIVILCLLCCMLHAAAQPPLLKVGDRFPDVMISNIVNAPAKQFFINAPENKRFYILNCWGTWCSPCLPEMDQLAVLQKNNAGKVQVIAISDDDTERKMKYLQKKPSGIWLATDTVAMLYNLLRLAHVGQCAIVSPEKKIVAILKTDSLNQGILNKILNGAAVSSNATIKEPEIINTDDFGVDSLLGNNFTIRGYMQGKPGMRRAPNKSYFDGRRNTSYNCALITLYSDAYDIHARNQYVYDSSVNKAEITDYENKQNLYCMDLLVSPQQKDSILFIMQQKLNDHLAIKARIEKRKLPVYILKRKENTPFVFTGSKETESSYGFSGRGYEGTGIVIKDFAKNYLTNELGLFVVDETGLPGRYDIKLTINLRDKENMKDALEKNGLTVQQTEREIPVLVFYK
jgi:uncharacterized protein (TIGR03435 family)